MPKYNLDHLVFRLNERLKVREEMHDPLYRVDGQYGSEGGWNEAPNHVKKNWNLTEIDMKDIEEALEEDSVFATNNVVTRESSVNDCNDAMERMKRGDCSKFNHLPPLLREYYGKKAVKEILGSDEEFPPLDDELKKKLDKGLVRPEFRYALSLLIERNAIDKNGKPVADRIREYDTYMNQRIMTDTLNPVSPECADNIRKKYPGEKGERLLKENKFKQTFIAKTMFLAQLGRTDIYQGEEIRYATPFEGNVTELFSHGGRVMFTLPQGDPENQDVLFDGIKKKAIDNKVLIDGRFASHDISRRRLDIGGEIDKPAEEIKLVWQDQLKNFEFNKPVTTRDKNYGMNFPSGGLGKKFNGKDYIDGQGTFGHLYVRMKKGDENHCGALLIGVENSAPKTESCIGQLHNYKAIGHDMSTFFANKKTIGASYGGREIDLSNMKTKDLAKALREFEAGYVELQNKAEKDPEAAKQLRKVNSMLCGRKLTAIEMAALMTSLGIEKKDAIRYVETGRSYKYARYYEDTYREDMRKIKDPAKVDERVYNPVAVGYKNELKNMYSYVDSMRRQWKAMACHTPFSFMNSSEFKKMDKALCDYLHAYDNVMAGKTVDGKEYRANPKQLSEEEYNKLKTLEDEMTKTARDYHKAKVDQKKGGFDKHISDQAMDRDAMSIMIANFSEQARIPVSENDMQKLKAMSEEKKNDIARRKLGKRVQSHLKEASENKNKTSNAGKKTVTKSKDSMKK